MTRKFGFMVAILLAFVAASCGGDDSPVEPSGNGKIVGRVTDGSAPVAGASIQTVPATASLLSDADGRFTIENVPAGTYVVHASKTGFNAGSVAIAVAAGESATAEIVLSTGPANRAPTEPGSPLPTDNAVSQPIELTLRWSSTDPDGDSIRYDVYFGSSNPPTLVSAAQIQPAHYIAALDSGATYYWQVIARDGRGGVSGSPVWRFRTAARGENRAPMAPYNPQPADGAVRLGSSVDLQWMCVDPEQDALRYDVYFGTTESPAKMASNIEVPSLVRSGLAPSTVYYWRVVARDAHGGETAGPLWSFLTNDTVEGPPPTNVVLIAHYPLNGDAVDIAGGAHNGTVYGAVATADRKGTSGAAMSFSNRAYIRVPHSPALEFASSDFTICAWIKPAGGLSDYAGIITKCTPDAPEVGYQMVVRNSNQLGAQIGVKLGSRYYFDVVGSSTMTSGWHFVAMTVSRANKTVRLYLDGVAVASKVEAALANSISETAPLYIGRERQGVVWFNGAIDDVRLYSGVLTAQQILDMSRQ